MCVCARVCMRRLRRVTAIGRPSADTRTGLVRSGLAARDRINPHKWWRQEGGRVGLPLNVEPIRWTSRLLQRTRSDPLGAWGRLRAGSTRREQLCQPVAGRLPSRPQQGGDDPWRLPVMARAAQWSRWQCARLTALDHSRATRRFPSPTVQRLRHGQITFSTAHTLGDRVRRVSATWLRQGRSNLTHFSGHRTECARNLNRLANLAGILIGAAEGLRHARLRLQAWSRQRIGAVRPRDDRADAWELLGALATATHLDLTSTSDLARCALCAYWVLRTCVSRDTSSHTAWGGGDSHLTGAWATRGPRTSKDLRLSRVSRALSLSGAAVRVPRRPRRRGGGRRRRLAVRACARRRVPASRLALGVAPRAPA